MPSVTGLNNNKKEFHIYESTFSDIIGIMMFYFLAANFNPEKSTSIAGFTGNLVLSIAISLVVSYAIILVPKN